MYLRFSVFLWAGNWIFKYYFNELHGSMVQSGNERSDLCLATNTLLVIMMKVISGTCNRKKTVVCMPADALVMKISGLWPNYVVLINRKNLPLLMCLHFPGWAVTLSEVLSMTHIFVLLPIMLCILSYKDGHVHLNSKFIWTLSSTEANTLTHSAWEEHL